MRTTLISFLFAALTATASFAQSTGLQELNTGNEARGWEAVGRLDIVGKGFCTGTLIQPDLVLTAAHCLFDSAGETAVDVADIEFLAGLRNGRPEAVRSARSFLVHPSYDHADGETISRLRYDVALIVLNQPIRATEIEAFEVSQTAQSGTEIGVISYAEGREEAPSLQQICNLLGAQDGVLIMDCNVNFGASGSPVFRYENGQPRLVSVVSAMAEIEGQDVSLAPDLAEPLPFMLSQIQGQQTRLTRQTEDTPTTARRIRPGERADTGALFVRP